MLIISHRKLAALPHGLGLGGELMAVALMQLRSVVEFSCGDQLDIEWGTTF